MNLRSKFSLLLAVLTLCLGVTGSNTAAAASGATLEFSSSTYSVDESAGSVTVSVKRTGSFVGAVSVRYNTTYGTALDGIDYYNTWGDLTWADGDSTVKTFTVQIPHKTILTANRSFSVNVLSPKSATLGSPSTAEVIIIANLASRLAFNTTGYTVARNAGSVSVVVARTGSAVGTASVRYNTEHGTAFSGTDYSGTEGVLNWAAGDLSVRTITVPIIDKTTLTGNRSFSLKLSGAKQALIGAIAATTVTITPGAESVGSLQFGSSSQSVAQSAGSLNVTVDRAGGSAGAVGVTYATSNGTAVAGTNFTATSGTLEWVAGDTSSKTFSVPVSDEAKFSGSKTFSVGLSNPTGGATLSAPATATVAIMGAAATTGGPSAVTQLQLINQGGPNNANAALTNYQQISWNAATAGANPIASYNIYRNGVLYANTTGLSYADTDAPNSNSPNLVQGATIYSYNVAAVDTQGNVGPQAAQMSVYGYQNGVSNWSNYDFSYGGVVENYSSTAGNPRGGKYDVSIYYPGGGFQPVSHAPQAPVNDLELGAFKYFTIDINPGATTNYTLRLSHITRLPPGDVYPWSAVENVFDYGPAPQPNTWATYKIPLSLLTMGECNFTGSISGTTLTVTSVQSANAIVDAGGFITGPGVPAGTYIVGHGQNGSIGTFTLAGPGISGSTSVSSTSMLYQRTAIYKFDIYPSISGVTVYYNNFGWTTN